MVKRLVQYYQIFSDLSLDVVFGVICCMLPLPRVFGVEVNFAWYVGLPLATWFVYLLDHLNDLNQNPKIYTSRHQLIGKFKPVVLLLLLLIISTLMLLNYFNFDFKNILGALIIIPLCLVYFALTIKVKTQLQWFYNKELLVAVIYATSVYVVIGLSQPLWGIWLRYYLIFIGIAYQNVLLISILEIGIDKQNEQYSWVALFGEKIGSRFFVIITLLIGLTIGWTWMEAGLMAKPLLASYFLISIIQFALYKSKIPLPLLRKLSEIVFWLPGFIILF